MAIYPDKKDGKLTGRFRVELQRGKERYRKRWDTLAEAKQDEAAVTATWARGEVLDGSKRAPGAPEAHMLADTIDKARGMLWPGAKDEATCFAHLQTIAGIVGPHARMDAIDTHSVDKVVTSLTKQGKSEATINRYLSHFRTFLKWAKGRKYRTEPIQDVEFSWRKESPGRIRWITLEEQRAIGAYLTSRGRQEADDVWELIEIAIETGCRRDELLTVELLQLNGCRLHLWATKTDTPRTVPLRPETAARLRKLVEEGRMPTRRGLRSWWQRVRKHMGLDGDADFVFHACRHTCATRMVDAGINVFVIKEWMGHKVMETTLRYAHVKPKNLEEALLRVGEHLQLVTNNPEKSVISQPPHTFPTSGGNGELEEAA